MALAPSSVNNIFTRCAPAIRTNISECGSVTLCQNVKPETMADLEDIYTKDGEYRILEHLFMTHFQIKACGAVQHGLRDFFIANAKITRKGEIKYDQNDRALTKVAPFLLAEQRIPRNNIYWEFSNGQTSSSHWVGNVASQSGIPADVRSFPPGINVWVKGLTNGGSVITSQYTIVSSVLANDGNSVVLTLSAQNTGNLLPTISTANPTKGVLYRGVVNIGKTESYCEDEPAYVDTKRVPFWIQHTRWTSCNSELYNEWLGLVLENNPLYREFYYVPEAERMRQKGEAFEDRLFNTLWFQGPISDKQNLTEYDQLDPINNFLSDTGLGVEGARCVGRRANAVGWLEQLRECNRWIDCQGAALNLYSIFDAIYQMRRVRAGIGSAAQMRFDVFTDGITAEQLDLAFIKYYGTVFNDKDRYIMDITKGTNDELGLQFSSYRLRGKNNGVTLNVISDWAFDDQLSEYVSQGLDNAGRSLLFLDMTGLYMKVIESNVVKNHTGDLKNLAAVDASFACVEETYTRDTTLNGLTFTAVLECPAANLVLENFSDAVPAITTAGRPNYLPTTTVTPYAI